MLLCRLVLMLHWDVARVTCCHNLIICNCLTAVHQGSWCDYSASRQWHSLARSALLLCSWHLLWPSGVCTETWPINLSQHRLWPSSPCWPAAHMNSFSKCRFSARVQHCRHAMCMCMCMLVILLVVAPCKSMLLHTNLQSYSCGLLCDAL